MLVGIVIGILLGLVAALGVALYIHNGPSPFTDKKPGEAAREDVPAKPGKPDRFVKPAEPATATPATSAPGQPPAGAAARPRFEFYGILQGKEEQVKEKDVKPAAARDVYYIQAGAFPSAAEADNLKAKLALAGIEAAIQTAQLPDGKTWHRVRLGPIRNVEDISRAVARLKENQVQGLVIKVKDAAPRP
jgi:cell division protein FtsN